MKSTATLPVWTRWSIGLILAAITLGLYLSTKQPSGPVPADAQYPGPWLQTPHIELTKALAANGVMGCGQFAYRPATQQPGEFLLYCTADGRLWRSYVVWLPSGRLTGPMATVPGIDPPA